MTNLINMWSPIFNVVNDDKRYFGMDFSLQTPKWIPKRRIIARVSLSKSTREVEIVAHLLFLSLASGEIMPQSDGGGRRANDLIRGSFPS